MNFLTPKTAVYFWSLYIVSSISYAGHESPRSTSPLPPLINPHPSPSRQLRASSPTHHLFITIPTGECSQNSSDYSSIQTSSPGSKEEEISHRQSLKNSQDHWLSQLAPEYTPNEKPISPSSIQANSPISARSISIIPPLSLFPWQPNAFLPMKYAYR